MDLTSAHLEAIRKAAQAVEYGRVTIHISASSRTLDLTIENRVKIEKEIDAPDGPQTGLGIPGRRTR
jgi:hypothetical protein